MFVVGLGSPDLLAQADMVAPSLEHLTVDQVFDQFEK
jgi:beta-phosphoglucomutase